MPKVTVLDKQVSFDAPAGAYLMESLDERGVYIMHACGGNCICGTCHVEVVSADPALPTPAPDEAAILAKLKRQGPGVRLSCQLEVRGDISIRINP